MSRWNLKKSIAIGLAAMALFASFGCGSDEKKSSGSSEIIALPQTMQQKVESPENQAPKEPTLKEKGNSCYREGNYTEAISYYTQAINAGTNAYLERGDAYRQQEEYPLAIADYTRVIEDGKQRKKQIEKQRNSASEQNKSIYDFIVSPDFLMADAYFGRGTCYAYNEEWEKAIEDYNNVLEIRPTHAVSHMNRGVCYDRLGDFGQALANYTKAIELNPKDALSYKNRAITYRRLGYPEKAEADFAKAQELEANQ